jgi:hypothetical protein
MIIHREYAEATATAEVALDHHCPHCRHVAEATVRGEGSATSADFNPQSDANFHAKDNAQRDAALLIRLAPCQKCRMRDGAEVRRLFIGGVLHVIGAVGLAGVAYVLFFLGAFEVYTLLLCLGALSMLFYAVYTPLKRWRGSTERVRFSGVK